MDGFLRQSTAVTVKIGAFVDSTDGNTAETGLTIAQADVRLSKNGGNMAQKNDATSCTHDEIGQYDCPLNATDTNTLGILKLMVHKTGALQVWATYMVMPANVFDSLFGADRLQVHADEITVGLITAAAIATDAIDADAIADNAINAGAIADGALTAAKFASGAIDAAAVAADIVNEIVDAVWDEATSGHAGAGTTGKALSDAGTAGDPWNTTLPGAYGAGKAGYILGNGVNAASIGGSATAATRAGKAYQGIVTGQFVTGTLTSTSATTNLSGYGNDTFNGRALTVISGARAGEQTTISDHAETGGLLTFAALTGAPANGDEFFIA